MPTQLAATMLEEMAVTAKAMQPAGQAAKTVETSSMAATGASTLSKVGKVAGVIGIAVDGGIRVHTAIETEMKFEGGRYLGQGSRTGPC